MRYTLGQAAKRLSAASHAYGACDVRESINRAIESLAGLAGWECLRHVFRFFSVGPCFALPQGSAGLVRACVNGRPVSVRGQDFRFLQSGPGDLNTVPPGFMRVNPSNIIDLGESPVMIEPPRPFRIFACSDSTEPSPAITVRGITPEGRITTLVVPVNSAPVYSGGTIVSGCRPEEAVELTTVLQNISDVTVDDSSPGYITLYAEGVESGDRYAIAVYHPRIPVPRFRRYSLPGVKLDQPVELLVEARVEPLTLFRDDEPLPIDGIDPIRWMMDADWCMNSGEVDKARKYQESAMQWMKAKEVVKDTVQTTVVINSVFDNSMGEISKEAYNI